MLLRGQPGVSVYAAFFLFGKFRTSCPREPFEPAVRGEPFEEVGKRKKKFDNKLRTRCRQRYDSCGVEKQPPPPPARLIFFAIFVTWYLIV